MLQDAHLAAIQDLLGYKAFLLQVNPTGIERSSPTSSFASERELFRGRIAVLLAADPAVVSLGRFVELEVPVRRKGFAPITQPLHLLRRHGLEVARDG